jgi:hypothetical protein
MFSFVSGCLVFHGVCPHGFRVDRRDTIIVKSHDLNTGVAISGFFVDERVNGNHIVSGYTPVKFTGLSPNFQYQVVVYWYGSYYFRHFSNGNLNRYALVTFSSTGQTTKLNALYENVHPLKRLN